MGADYAVELHGISKTYRGGISEGGASCRKANDSISLNLRKGEILCIAGENGAGKTTLMKILNGSEKPDEGAIIINNNPVIIDSPLAARRLGIGMLHQHYMLFPEYTAAQNIVMGMEPRKWGIFFDAKKAKSLASELITAHHFSIDPDTPIKNLGIGEMQQVEICRLLYRNANIIILDEPGSVLTDYETAALFNTLKTLASAGKSIFLITHKLEEIKLIANRVAVLRNGALAGILEANDIDEHTIFNLMSAGVSESGSDNEDSAVPRRKRIPGSNTKACDRPILIFDKVTVVKRGQRQPPFNKVSFSVQPGEILGFTGVGGNGLGVLEAVLGGFLHPGSGKITHNGNDITRFSIRRLRKQGLAYVPADRLHVGSAPKAAINDNVIINRRRDFFRFGLRNHVAIANFKNELFSRFNITSGGGSNAAAGALSGGNLQKLILAREIDQGKDYFVFSEPTRGLDIASGNFVRNEILKLRDKGAAIAVISTSLDDILTLSNRIIVMYRGQAFAQFNLECENEDPSSLRKKIGAAMQGFSRTESAIQEPS